MDLLKRYQYTTFLLTITVGSLVTSVLFGGGWWFILVLALATWIQVAGLAVHDIRSRRRGLGSEEGRQA